MRWSGLIILSTLGATILTATGCSANSSTAPAPTANKVVSNSTANTSNSNSTNPIGAAEDTTQWVTYANGRFGFSFRYPSTFIKEAPPTDGDGLGFYLPVDVSGYNNGSSTDAHTTTVVMNSYGALNFKFGTIVNQNFDQMATSFKSGQYAQDSAQPGVKSVSVKMNQGQWIEEQIVKSVGQNATEIDTNFYTLQNIQTLTMVYPNQQETTYKPMYDAIVQTFQVGKTNM